MGMFDDLIPQETAPAGAALSFDDLIPKKETVGQRLRAQGHNIKDDVAAFDSGLSFQGVGQGLKDIRNAGSQLIGRGLTAVAPAGSDFEKWAKDQTDIVERRNAQNEADYQGQRTGTGLDAGRLIGNVIGTAPFAPMGAATLPGRIASNALTGGGIAAVSQPVNEPGGSFWAQKGKQAGLGAIGSVAMMPVTESAARVVSPNASTNPNIQKLLSEGVSLTPGQMAGGMVKRVEDASTSIPLLGDAVRSAQRAGVEDLNASVYNRVLAPLGEALPKDMKPGREAVAYVQKKVSSAYDSLLPKMTAQVDPQFAQDTAAILQKLQAVDPNIATQFGNTFQKMVVDRFAPNGQLEPVGGDILKRIETDLGSIASTYKPKGGGEGLYGQAISEVQDALRGLLARSNPQHAVELSKANEAFRNLVVLDKAAAGQGAAEGVFSPNQLSSAVKGSDRSARDRAFAGGRATMQDLSDAAKAVMPSSVPDSGTPLRAFLGMGALGQAAMLPAMAGSALYTQPSLALLQALMARRPAGAPAVAQGLRDLNPAFGSALATTAPRFGLLN